MGQATAFAALENDRSTLAVGHIARVVAQIELRAVAAQMGFAQMMIGVSWA
jgi:hypothetical protein